jgi:putative PIN family toxin of toxin-antitoxin system
VVLDTNTVISGLLWHGAPRKLLDNAREGRIQLFTSVTLLDELYDVLNREKFFKRLRRVGITPWDLVVGFASLGVLVKPANIELVIADDPDDDAVLACAIAAQAELIVSGDSHLLNLGGYRDIPIVAAGDALSRIS